MTTAVELIRPALYLSGASSPINPAIPELENIALDVLRNMLYEWESLNINLGVTVPTELTTELNNPPDTNEVIKHRLAVRIAAYFQLSAPMNVKAEATRLYDNLLTVYAPHPLPEWPDTLPRGSGNTRGTKPQVFFPPSEGLTDDNGVPLIGGSGS